MSHLFQRINTVLGHRWAGWLLLAIVAAAFAVAHFTHPLFPGHGAVALERGWWTWTDQHRYLDEAAAIARCELTPETYAYPVGYPALGALFWRWMPSDPFFIPDLLLAVGTAAIWWRLALRWFSRVGSIVIGVLFLATHRRLVAQAVLIPWNTLATQFTLLTGIWLVVARTGPRTLWLLGVLAAATYVVRPVDALSFAPLLVLATLRLATWRSRLISGLGAALVVLFAVIAVGTLNRAIFSQWRSPYETVSMQIVGFFSYPVSYKAFWLMVDGQPLFHEIEPALLFRYPWLFLALPGAVYWVHREGKAAAAAIAAIAINWALYLNYNDFLPSDVYRFTLIHYLAWSFPLLFAMSAAACRAGWGNRPTRWAFGIAGLALIACMGLRLEPRERALEGSFATGWLLPPQRPLLVRFPGAPADGMSKLRLEGRALVEYSEYLVPYVPSELQFLLGTRTAGTRLTTVPGVILPSPLAGEYRWQWRPSTERLKLLCR